VQADQKQEHKMASLSIMHTVMFGDGKMADLKAFVFRDKPQSATDEKATKQPFHSGFKGL
jgi:hypothetical protein